MIKAIPFIFNYEPGGLRTELIEDLINNNSLINLNDNIIGRIRGFYVDELEAGIPSKIYLWISANKKNERNSVKIKNENLDIDGIIDSQHTVLQDFVIVLSFLPNGDILTTGNGNNSGLSLVFFEGYSRMAMGVLNHISDMFTDFISSFMAFQQSEKYLEEIVNFIDEIKTDYIAPYNNGTFTRDVIYGTYTFKPKYTNGGIDTILHFIENTIDFVSDVPNITRRLYITAFGKKIPLSEEDGRFIAMSFPQNIDLSIFDNGNQVNRFFNQELSNYNSGLNDEALLGNNENIYNMCSLKDYLGVLIDEYENSLVAN